MDTSVTFTGNSVLSALDIAKMECLYYCDGTNPGTCGGHKYGKVDIISELEVFSIFKLHWDIGILGTVQACTVLNIAKLRMLE